MAKLNLQESKIWKDTFGTVQRLWTNYLQLLNNAFRNMSRTEQEELIAKFSWLLTIGGVILAWCPVYALFPTIIKVFALPLSLFLAYWFGKNIVSKIMIDRFSKYLNTQ